MSDTLHLSPVSFPEGLRGFAAFVRTSHLDDEDVEMVAKKFEAAADEIEYLENELSCALRLAAEMARLTPSRLGVNRHVR